MLIHCILAHGNEHVKYYVHTINKEPRLTDRTGVFFSQTLLRVFEREASGTLEKAKAQSALTFRSADWPHPGGIRPAQLKHPQTWTAGPLIHRNHTIKDL